MRRFDVSNFMTKLLAFKTIAFDTNTLAADVPILTHEYFKDQYAVDGDNVTKEVEEAIIKWMLGSPAKELFLSELRVGHNSFIDYNVKQPIIENPQKKPGDIDLLICPGHKPTLAIAFQCKRVVVKSLGHDDVIRKLPKVVDLVTQANEQRKQLGFHRNYLAILIMADGSKKLNDNILFRGCNQETFQKIYEFPDRERIHNDVGIVFIEISQPTGKNFKEMAVVGICIEREASPLDQSTNLTNRIEVRMRQKSKARGIT